MIKANFKAYSTYITDSLHQWDINQTLEVTGLNLTTAPEVHFSNSNSDRAIVRQATLSRQVVSVKIPNSLLQEPHRIFAHIGVYECDTFKVVELVEIPVQPRKRPEDYQLTDADEEVYSFKRLENLLANKADAREINARVDNILAHNNDTNGNSELVDIRTGVNGENYNSAGAAVRTQFKHLNDRVGTYYGEIDIEAGQLGAASNTFRMHATPGAGLDHLKVVADDGYKHALQGYTSGSYATKTYDSGWVTGGAVYNDLDPALHYNVEFLRFDEGRMTEGDLGAVSVLRSIDLTKTVADLQRVTASAANGLATQMSLYGTYYNRADVLLGSLSGSSNTYRLHVLLAPNVSNVDITAPDGYVYGVQGYAADNYASRVYDSGWLSGDRKLDGMDSSLFYNIEFRMADESLRVPSPEDSGIIVLQSLTLTDIVDGLVKESAERELTNYHADNDFVRSIAHRGYSAEAPENTAPAFILAKKKGFNYVETDIQVTADGKYVCVHDELCSKYTGGKFLNAVSTYTLAELQAQDWGAWKGEKWVGVKILTFEEFVALCKRLSLKMYIELKYEHSEADVAYYINHLKRLGVLDKVSWLPAAQIDTVRRLHPSARVAITGSVAPTDELIERYKEQYKTAEDDFFFDLAVTCVTPELSDKLTEAGIPLEVWTVNDKDTLDDLLTMNISGITTDGLLVGAELLKEYK
jgi:glycerophosphoryl diester phosphodiesterase